MKSTDVWSSDCSPATRSSTSASTVASRPVVGSSRMSSAGSMASAIAITTRCCIPPESWCGYRSITEPGSAIWTSSRACRARSVATLALSPRILKTSATWFPTLSDGFSAAPGFW
jgi:hypothetical protein